jgi:hypothetical protein
MKGPVRAVLCRVLARGTARADAGPDEAPYEGALLFHASVPTSEFGRPWPHGVPLQIHMMDADEWGLGENAAALLTERVLGFLDNIE